MTAHRNLVRELKRLRKGRGVYAGGVDEKIGPILRAACGITGSDGPSAARQKLITRLTELVELLPDDLQLAARAAFALNPEARLALYQDRVFWVAAVVDRDARTVRRRIDDAVDQLAELAAKTTHRDTAGWHLAELHVSITLDHSKPEIVERHRLVIDAEHVDEVEFTALLAVPPRDVRLIYGGTLQHHGVVRHGRPDLTVVPAEPLPHGETFDFEVRYELDTLRPELLYLPDRPCEQFDLRVRFSANHMPQVQRFDGEHRWDPPGLLFPVDRAGEVHLRFRRLLPGMLYGVRWENAAQWQANSNELADDLARIRRGRQTDTYRTGATA